jgi:tripartite-type tricarboxylate transporter receptor subunit TctC
VDHASSNPRSITRRTVLAGLAALAGEVAIGQTLRAAGSPRSIIVPFPAGFVTDALARRLAELFEEVHGVPFVVENLPGAGGVIAATQLLKRPADGRTLLLAHSGLVCNLPLLAETPLAFNPRQDLVAVCTLADTPPFAFVGKSYPAHSLRELQRVSRGADAPLLFATPAQGGAYHIAGLVLMEKLGIKAEHVPYRDGNQLLADVSEGRVAVGIHSWDTIAPFYQAGRIAVLCSFSEAPFAFAPQVPTPASAGITGVDINGWVGLFVAKGSPPAAVAEYAREVAGFFRTRSLAAFLTARGIHPGYRDPEASKAFVEAEIHRYEQLLRTYGLVR